MTSRYDMGDKPRLTGTFSVNSVNTDPTAIVLIIRLPDGTHESFLSATGFTSQGSWNASTNTPTLADGTGTAGHYYTVSAAASVDLGSGSQSFAVGDYVAYDGDVWLRIPSPQSGTLTKSATGIYLYDYPVHQNGIFYYRFEGFGSVHAADEVGFQVHESEIR